MDGVIYDRRDISDDLQQYFVRAEIGLESSPDAFVAEMVAVFREARRVLRDDGCAWINLGDSYAANRSYQVADGKHQAHDFGTSNAMRCPDGLKPKDLIGIPWRVARALQEPYYAGRIKNELDRIWLAAMIDAEGCIFIHKRKAGTSAHSSYERVDGTVVEYKRTQDTFGVGIEVSNTSLGIVERCKEITGAGSICKQEKGRRQTLYRWNLRTNECKWVIEEVYPYLIAKQHQARLLLGCPSSGDMASAAHEGLIALHNGGTTHADFAAPKSLFQQGWYLRQDVIWSKLNPMPESVRDRCTKAHEYVFLLTKSARYWYDADAVKETSIHAGRVVEYDGTQKNSAAAADPKMRTRLATTVQVADTRNKRSVWTVATQPFSDWTEIVRWDRVEQDAVSDDSLHIAFPNCPSYGGLFDLLAMAGCDGHVGDGLLRSLRTDGRLSEEPQHGFVPIDQILAWGFGERRLDELLGWCSETAIGRSIRSRKTGLFLATSPACTPSDERHSRIERTLEKLGSSAQHLDIDASNIWAFGFAESRRPQTLWRNVGKSDVLGLSGAYALFYGKNTQKTSHFATYPPALIEPCILAGCPKHTCAKCGNVLDSDTVKLARSSTNGNDMRSVWEGVSEASITPTSQQVLQSSLQGRSSEAGNSAVRGVRQTCETGQKEPTEAVLLQDLCEPAHGAEQRYDDRTDSHVEGIRDAFSAGSSERDESRVCDGTSNSDRKGYRADAVIIGGGASQERSPAGQQAGEFGTTDKTGSRQTSERAHRRYKVSVLQNTDQTVATCANCSADLTTLGAIQPGRVLDPFGGAGTTGLVAARHHRQAILCELNPAYAEMAHKRISREWREPVAGDVEPIGGLFA